MKAHRSPASRVIWRWPALRQVTIAMLTILLVTSLAGVPLNGKAILAIVRLLSASSMPTTPMSATAYASLRHQIKWLVLAATGKRIRSPSLNGATGTPILITAAGQAPMTTGLAMATGDIEAKKSLGQHWLNDGKTLATIAALAEVN